MRPRWLYSWALGSVAFGGASLLVPLYIVRLGATPVQLGLLAATAAVIGAPGAVAFGRLANRTGRRRPLVLVTLGTVALALAGVPFLRSVAAVIAVNAALWLVVGSVAPVLTVVIVDGVPEAEWNDRIGLLNTYQGYGWAGGLLLGTAWPLVGDRIVDTEMVVPALFWVLAACAAASAAGAARSLPRSGPAARVRSERRVREIARLLAASNRGIRGATFAFSPNRLYWSTRAIRPRRLLERLDPALTTYLGAAALFFTGFAAFWAPLPLFLSTTGFASEQIFALYLASSLASAALYGSAGAVASRYDLRVLQSGALAVRGALFPAIALVAGIGGLTVGFGAVGVGLAAIGGAWAVVAVAGTAIVVRLAPPGARGEVLGVYTGLGSIAGGAGGVLGGWAATFGYRAAFGAAGGLVLLGAGLVLSLRTLSIGTRAGGSGGEAVADRADGRSVSPATGQTEETTHTE
jgi:MFS family permease